MEREQMRLEDLEHHAGTAGPEFYATHYNCCRYSHPMSRSTHRRTGELQITFIAAAASRTRREWHSTQQIAIVLAGDGMAVLRIGPVFLSCFITKNSNQTRFT
jgi:hypothetical protein